MIFFFKKQNKILAALKKSVLRGMADHTYNPSAWGGSKFKPSLDNLVRSCLEEGEDKKEEKEDEE